MSEADETPIQETHTPLHTPRSWARVWIAAGAFLLFFAIRSWLPVDPVPEGHTIEGVRTGVAILVLGATLWLSEALPLAMTAILIPLVASLTGSLDVQASFAGFAHPLIYLFLGDFGLAAALSARGSIAGSPTPSCDSAAGTSMHAFALFSVSAVLSMWISNTATVALLLPVALGGSSPTCARVARPKRLTGSRPTSCSGSLTRRASAGSAR